MNDAQDRKPSSGKRRSNQKPHPQVIDIDTQEDEGKEEQKKKGQLPLHDEAIGGA